MFRLPRLLILALLSSGTLVAQTETSAPVAPPPPASVDAQQPAAPRPLPAPNAQAPQPPAASDAQQAPPQPAAAADSGRETVPSAEPVEKKAQKDTADASAGKSDSKDRDNDQPITPDRIKDPTLWHDPGNIASLNLFYGRGGEKHQPKPPFRFESEDMNGTNPKFDAVDAEGRRWRVKLGNEARPEVVASRLLWAMGYYVNDDYVLPDADVEGIHMKRGNNLIKHDHITDARFARKPSGEKKIGIWEWKQNPFLGTREFNGLRVMMAVMNNWDLKDVNNAVYREKDSDKQYFLVSDVGATFATTDFSVTKGRSKGNVKTFEKSKFITKVDRMEVSFATPSKPRALLIESMGTRAGEYAMRSGLTWIGHNIPRADAKWMGSLLGQLSHEQIVDAFRAGHFPPEAIDTYVAIVESRITELKGL